LVIPNKEDLMRFSLVIQPKGGYWDGGIFEFTFEVPAKYPFDGDLKKLSCQ
jgi:ubiquitin-protein ligase